MPQQRDAFTQEKRRILRNFGISTLLLLMVVAAGLLITHQEPRLSLEVLLGTGALSLVVALVWSFNFNRKTFEKRRHDHH